MSLSRTEPTSSSSSDESIECAISYMPLRYGIKFIGDPNWYEVYSALTWLTNEGCQNNSSPATTQPWCLIEETEDFIFPGCISDYDAETLAKKILHCLSTGEKPNLQEIENDQIDLPDLEDQRIVRQEIANFLSEELQRATAEFNNYRRFLSEADPNVVASIHGITGDYTPLFFAVGSTQTCIAALEAVASVVKFLGNDAGDHAIEEQQQPQNWYAFAKTTVTRFFDAITDEANDECEEDIGFKIR